MLSDNSLQAAVEAVIFASGEPVTPARLAEVLEVGKDVIRQILDRLQTEYAGQAHGFELVVIDGSYQFVTKLPYADHIKRALEIKRNVPLSNAALEALAVVAYNQPVTRSFVEQVRGVDSSGVMSTLQEKGLLEEAGRLDLPGRPVAYRVTDNFLRCFGMETLSDLPPLPRQELEQAEGAGSQPPSESAENDAADKLADGEQIYVPQAIEEGINRQSSN